MLIDPVERLPFYIGIGTRRRPKDHFREANDPSRKSHKVFKIRKLRRAGVADDKMLVFIAHDLTADVARCTEEWLIAEWGRRCEKETGILTNLSPGGERAPLEDPIALEKYYKTIYSEQHREKQRTRALAFYANASPEYRKKRRSIFQSTRWRKKHRALLNSPEVRAANSAAQRQHFAKLRSDTNPYIAGSIKARTFDAFRANGGNRRQTIAIALALGATRRSAVTYAHQFCKGTAKC